MKKNKYLLLLLLLIPFLTGCNVDVELRVDSANISERITIINYIDEVHTEEEIINSYKKYEPTNKNDMSKVGSSDEAINGIKYYAREQEVFNTFVKNAYSTNYSINSYNNSRSLTAFNDGKIVDGMDYIEISTDKNGLLLYNTYSDLGDVKVTLKTDLEVLDNNADKVENNNYIWNFSRDNNKSIYIKMKKNNNSDSGGISVKTDEEEFMNGDLQTLYLTLILLGVGIVIALLSSTLIKLVSY